MSTPDNPDQHGEEVICMRIADKPEFLEDKPEFIAEKPEFVADKPEFIADKPAD